MFAEEILLDIESTLEKLIKNAEALQQAKIEELTEHEIQAFQKTQESLLHHFLFLDQVLETKREKIKQIDKRSTAYKIQKKLTTFEELKNQVNITIREATQKHPLFAKRTRKRYLIF